MGKVTWNESPLAFHEAFGKGSIVITGRNLSKSFKQRLMKSKESAPQKEDKSILGNLAEPAKGDGSEPKG